jgi:hypothetical protein
MRPNRIIFAIFLSFCFHALRAQAPDPDHCTICTGNHQISISGDRKKYYLVVDKDTSEVGRKLTRVEDAVKNYREALDQKLAGLWDPQQVSGSQYTAYVNTFLGKVIAKFSPSAVPAPTLIDSIQLSPSAYVGLVKDQHNNYVISVYGAAAPVDVFAHGVGGYDFLMDNIGPSPEIQKALPAVLFLKNKVAGIQRPDLILSERESGGYALVKLLADGDTIPMGIMVDKPLGYEIELAARVGPVYKQHLLSRTDYIQGIRAKLTGGCAGCTLSMNETLLVYDHACQKFLYKPYGSDELHELEDLNKINVRYKRPLRINRYIYNLNLASSDISLTSQESALMQQYLLPGTNNGQPSPTNTYTNSGSSNGADFVFGNIAFFKANIDNILEKIKEITLPDIPTISTDVAVKITAAANLEDSASNRLTNNLRDINNQKPTNEDLYAQNAKAGDYLQSVNNVRDIISRISDASSAQIKNPVNGFLDSAALLNAQTVYLRNAKVLQGNFYDLRRYCDSFIDNRITAYSICTDDFPCCQTPLETYEHFESFLTAISNQIFYFMLARAQYNKLKNPLPPKPAAATPVGKPKPAARGGSKPAVVKGIKPAAGDSTKLAAGKGTKPAAIDSSKTGEAKPETKTKSDSTNPFLLNVASTDIAIANNRITGITLHQLPDTTKPKKAADTTDPANAIDSLWYNFEKSIPTDYIMRQIIFRNNMIRSNIGYTSPPIFPYGDRLGIVMQMPVADTVKRLGTMPASTTTFSADIPVFGKPLFSFSAGSFIGFGVRKPTYEWLQVPTPGSNTVQPTSPYKLAYSGPGAYPAGLDGMANLTWRPGWFRGWRGFNNNVWLGFSGGVGVVVDQPTVRLGYLLGGTASIGTYQQFHITVGGMAMNVNVLKTDLTTSQFYQTQPTLQQYNQKLQIGFFLSVSYTVFAPKSTGTMQNQVINAN